MEIWLIVGVTALATLTTIALVKSAKGTHENNIANAETAKVRVTNVFISGHKGIDMIAFITFKLKNGGHIKLSVTRCSHWKKLKIGDKGVLYYKGARFIKFEKE